MSAVLEQDIPTDFDPIRQSVFDRAFRMNLKAAQKAEAEHTFYDMTAGTNDAEYGLKSPNLDADCRFPFYAVNIKERTCTCPQYHHRVLPMRDELCEYGLPPACDCVHLLIVDEKLAAGWTPEPEQAEPVTVSVSADTAKPYSALDAEGRRRRMEADFG